jgi:hypothetical protein
MGRVFFTALAEGIAVDRRRFVFVPGNHDVSWFACERIEIDRKELGFGEDELRRRMDEVKMERFFGFVRGFWKVASLERAAISLGNDGYLVHFPKIEVSVEACPTISPTLPRRWLLLCWRFAAHLDGYYSPTTAKRQRLRR